MPLEAAAGGIVAEAVVKMTSDPMAAAAMCRYGAGNHGSRAKGYGGSKAENVSLHSVCSPVTVAPGLSEPSQSQSLTDKNEDVSFQKPIVLF
jgi:hypothetical protein